MSDSTDGGSEVPPVVDPDLEPIENPVADVDHTVGSPDNVPSTPRNPTEGSENPSDSSVEPAGASESSIEPTGVSNEIVDSIGISDENVESNSESDANVDSAGVSDDIVDSNSQAQVRGTASPVVGNGSDVPAADESSRMSGPAAHESRVHPTSEMMPSADEDISSPRPETTEEAVHAAEGSTVEVETEVSPVEVKTEVSRETALNSTGEQSAVENSEETHAYSGNFSAHASNPEQNGAADSMVDISRAPEVPSGPWVIDVNVVNAAGAESTIQVLIERSTDRKRWLGGFKHKKNGLEYHNVSTQTYRKAKPLDGKVRFTREVQTKQMSSGTTNNQQTVSVTSTQMTGTGCYVATTHDKIIVAKPYFSAAQREAQRLQAVVVLQSYFRRMQAVRYVSDLRRRKKEYDEWMAAEEQRKQEEEEAEFQSRIDRRLNPRTKDDFQLLYSGLEVWRQEQLGALTGKTGHDRTAALNDLLHQQCQYLSAIGQLKNLADEENRMGRIKRFFDTTAAPKRWVESEYGLVVEMETPDTIRARELREVYNGLNFENLENDERMDILLHTKLTVERFESKVSRELVDLIAREGDLLTRGTRQANLQGLRKRIRNLFLRLCEDKAFNPEAGKYLAVHKPKDTYQHGLLKCAGTENYLTHDEFVFRDPRHVPFNSKKANKIQNFATSRKDTTQYRRILENIRNTEVNKGYHSQVVFLVSMEDMVYIIDTIWGGKSVLSQEDEVFRLTLCRWDRDDEWSPWNCVLLTSDEAHVHETASKDMDLREVYGEALLRNVQQRHLRARTHFLSLVEVQQMRAQNVADSSDTSHTLPQSTTAAVAT